MTVEDFIVHMKSFDVSEQTADWFAEQQSYAESLGLSWTEICGLIQQQGKDAEAQPPIGGSG